MKFKHYFLSRKLSKKAEFTISMVVILILALVVLLAIIMITSGRINLFNKATAECPKGTHPETHSGGFCTIPEGQLPDITIYDEKSKETKYCCKDPASSK